MHAKIEWQHLSPEAREREYSPSSCIGGNYMPFIQAYADESAAARKAYPPHTHTYGAEPTQKLDLFLPPATGAPPPPLLVFIHGGYWQELSKEYSSFAASHCLPQGIAYAAIGYTLAPAATVGSIVQECRTALNWLFDNAGKLGVDRHRIVVAGSSAGAHLAAMCAAPGALAPSNRLKGAVLVSGVYELEPLIGTTINDALHLDATTAAGNSPMRQDLQEFPPSIVCWGDNETDQFKRQSRAFSATLRTAGTHGTEFEIPGRNHFNIILDLANPATELGRHVVAMIDATRS
jgi:arylformamidase